MCGFWCYVDSGFELLFCRLRFRLCDWDCVAIGFVITGCVEVGAGFDVDF